MADNPYTDYPEDDELARFRPLDTEIDSTSIGEIHRTELIPPPADSFDERLNRVRSRKMVQQPSQPSMPVLKKKHTRPWVVLPATLLLVLLTGGLVVVALLLPPFSEDSPILEALENDEPGLTALTSEKTRVEKEALAVEVHPGAPGKNFGVEIRRFTLDEFRAGEIPTENCPSAETVPAVLTPMGEVFSLAYEGTPPPRVGLEVPATAYDLYGWYPAAQVWQFVPAQRAADRDVWVTDVPVLPSCLIGVTVGNAAPELTINLDLGQARNDALSPNRLFIRGMQPTVQGNLQGVLPADAPTDAAYPIIPLISNYTAPDVIDAATVETILRNPATRVQHASDIAGFVEVNNYNGVALDYRGIAPELRNAYSELIKNIKNLLQNRTLILVLPPAEFDNSWQTGAYDWRTLGFFADELIIRMPLATEAFLPNGDVDAMLQWAVGEVSRTKLSLSVSALSVETAPNNPVRLVEMSQLWDGLGEVVLEGDTAFFDTPYHATLGFDETTQSPNVTYTYEDENYQRTFWIMNGSALSYRLQKAEQMNLRGVFIADVFADGVDSTIVDALFAYQSETPIEAQPEMQFKWTAYDATGEALAEMGLPPDAPFAFPEGTSLIEVTILENLQVKTVPVTNP